MKKSLLALAALTAFAGVASAQSSVTLFGIVDVNARSVKNGSAGSIKSLSTDGNASSRLGFRGIEDLGGGLRGGFWIEGALAPDTGNSSGQTWQRRSTVSLIGGFGEVRLGRDYTPTFWNHTIFDPFGTNGVASQTNLMFQATSSGSNSGSVGVPSMADQGSGSVLNAPVSAPGVGTGTVVRANNTIGYFLPALGGVYGQAMVAAGEGATGNKYIGGRIGYAGGPVNVAVAYGETDRTGAMVDDIKAINVGGSFTAGIFTVMGQAHKYEYGVAEQMNYLLGANIILGPGTFKVSYGMVTIERPGFDRDATQIGVGYVYDLSKRTAIYVHGSQVDNDAGLRFVASGSGPGNTAGAVQRTGFKSTAYEFGVRHSF